MKRIIKKSTTITESIVNDNGETLIVNRKHSIKNNSQLITEIITDKDWKEWKKLDQIYRQEIAKELEEYKQKNPFPQNKTEEK